MDFALAAVTIFSLTLTVAMAIVTWRLVREERRRSIARIAALAAELERTRSASVPDRAAHAEPVAVRTPATLTPPRMATPVVPAPVIDLPIRPAATQRAEGTLYRTSSELFAAPDADERWPRLAGAIGMAGFVVAAVVMTMILAFPQGEVVGDPLAGAEALAKARPNQLTALELVALGHEQTGAMLSISGSIRRPGSGRELQNLFVMAMGFDRGGSMIASGRSPVDRTNPGSDELGFSVKIPAQGVTRYRISFLDGASTVAHIDRRGGAVASTRSASLSKRIGDQP